MNITVKVDGIKELISSMDDLSKKQVPFATAKALTKTAQDVKAAELQELQRSIDRPTPYTMNSLYVKSASKTNLESMVYFKDKSSAGKGNPAANFILPHVEGGVRNVKRFESALQRIGLLPKGMYIAPGEGCQLDAYGNIPSSLIVQILSYFQAFGEQGYRANMTDKKKAALAKGSKRKGTMDYEYFVSYGKGTWSGRQHLFAGIYKRIGFSKGSAIKPIMMFVSKPGYQKRFPFYETAQKVIDQNLITNFNEAMDEAIKTAK
jgi:hypothetical protein